MATTTYSDFPLATLQPWTGGGDSAAPTSPDNDGGASGSSGGQSFEISTGALIAIILVVVIVALLGMASATLFLIAKKREWTIRETIRKSAKAVVTALTPRRSEFPRSVKEGSIKSRTGHVKMETIPPTPRLTQEDLEKGAATKVDVNRSYFNRK